VASFPTPTYTPGSLGNGINAVSLAHGTSIACLIDATLVLGVAANCQILTGASAITAAVTFSMYRAPGQTKAAPQTTLSAGPSSGATSISVTSATGIGKNCLIAIIPAAGGVGEIVTVSNVSGTTLTVGALTNSYSSSDLVFLLEQTPTGGASSPGSSWAANTEYGSSLYPPASWLWICGVKNTDTSNAATISITYDTSS
jgi:hypothetical protein